MGSQIVRRALPALAFGFAVSSIAVAQQPAAAPETPVVSMVGQTAPDFTIRVSTKNGPQSTSFRLSEHKGETVVLAFFYAARSKG